MQFELDCFRMGGATPLVPASRKSVLFEENEHAERCLPLSIANTLGWTLLCPDGVTIEWNGGPASADLTITFDHPERWATSASDTTRPPPFARSHFATGIVTFELGWLFRTPQDCSLWAMGPPNSYKDGISPLSGVIETFWVDYSFTMNWKMTRPGAVRFEEGEAFCFITPTVIPAIAACQPIEHQLSDHPELAANIRAGGAERDRLMARMNRGDPNAIKHPWGRRYWLGQQPEGSTAPAPTGHTNKVRTKPPIPATPPSATFDQAGRFSPSPRTRIVRCAADAADLDFLVIDKLLSAKACADLRDFYDANPDLREQGHQDRLWQNRLIGIRAALAKAPETGAHMIGAARAAIGAVRGYYAASAPLYVDALHLARWGEGDFMPVHADNAYRDAQPHVTAHRAYSGLFYLSDDYDGGGLYLPHQDVLIVPSAGMFVSLPGGLSHEHGVVRVDRGGRYTMPFFLTFSKEKADRVVHPEAVAPALSFAATANFANLGAVNFSVVPAAQPSTASEPA